MRAPTINRYMPAAGGTATPSTSSTITHLVFLPRRFGITSFVYSRRRPFHPHRLRETVVRWMPVSSNKETGGTAVPENNASPIRAVMRSKGFMWLSSGHATAFYWSHAGQHFEIRCAPESVGLALSCTVGPPS